MFLLASIDVHPTPRKLRGAFATAVAIVLAIVAGVLLAGTPSLT